MPPVFTHRVHILLQSINPEANPGVPYNYRYKRNIDLVRDWGTVRIAEALWDRLGALLQLGRQLRPELEPVEPATLAAYHITPKALVDLNCCDPIRVFVKNELHTKSKAEQGRWRLIMNLSFIDNLIERVLNARLNDAEILRYEGLPFQPGMGHHDEGLQVTINRIAEFGDPVSSDVSMFDWSVSHDWLWVDARSRCERMRNLDDLRFNPSAMDTYNVYCTLMHTRVLCLSWSLLVIRDGTAFAQRVLGIQKSGSYNTSSTNSHIRYALSLLAGAKKCICMGDDAVEEYSDQAVEVYQELGYQCKHYERSSLVTGVEFCGHLYKQQVCETTTTRPARLLGKLLNNKPQNQVEADQLVAGLVRDLRYHPELSRYLEVIQAVGWGPPETLSKESELDHAQERKEEGQAGCGGCSSTAT
jgi:hypothetical protein